VADHVDGQIRLQPEPVEHAGIPAQQGDAVPGTVVAAGKARQIVVSQTTVQITVQGGDVTLQVVEGPAPLQSPAADVGAEILEALVHHITGILGPVRAEAGNLRIAGDQIGDVTVQVGPNGRLARQPVSAMRFGISPSGRRGRSSSRIPGAVCQLTWK